MLGQIQFTLIIFFVTILSLSGQDITLGQGNNDAIVVTTSSSTNNTNGANTVNSQGFVPNLNASSRFLSQATFGPNFSDIESISSQGIESWIDTQLSLGRGPSLVSKVIELKNIKNQAEGTPFSGAFDYFWDIAWWNYAMTSEDDLRQRVALALSEFFVVSIFSSFGDNAYALASYYDMLLNNSFNNYRTLLDSVTYHPAMGEYLTYMNNSRADTIYTFDWEVWPPDTLSVQYTFPDENYAREVMQLFSIGLCELNIDGSCKKDENGIDIPSYDNVDIAEFAKVFTGFSYGDNSEFDQGPVHYEETFLQPMQIYNAYHEPGVKNLLNGVQIEDRLPVDGHADVSDALDNLFNHPNVGPFLGKFMIQRLVTSNPSPSYITRVAEAFNGDGPFGTIRGDMSALIKAILLDEEARGCQLAEDDAYGMLREPFIRYLQLGRAFNVSTTSGQHRNSMENVYDRLGQKPLASPSVFNFFQSDYQPIGRIEEAGKVAPEFQIANTQSISGYINALNDWLMLNEYTDVWTVHNQGEDVSGFYPTMDYSIEKELTDDEELPQLIERLNVLLAHGKLTEATIESIIEAIKAFEVEEIDCVAANTYDCQEVYDWCISQCAEGDQTCLDQCQMRLNQCPDDIQTNIMYCIQDLEDQRVYRVKLAIFLVMASPEYLINR